MPSHINNLTFKFLTAFLAFIWTSQSGFCAGAAEPQFSVSEHRCTDEHGLGSETHEAALNRLDGRRIVFVGDLTVRYQYLELAYYLSHGRCPDPDDVTYILDQDRFDSFNEFYRVSSELLNVRRASLRSRELCICTRLSMRAGDVEEQRSYVYEDIQGRTIELFYEQYFREEYGRLQTILLSAEAVNPTDVLVSYGFWQRQTETSCGADDGDPKDCVGLQWMCWMLTRKNITYKIWWVTVTPYIWEEEVVDVIPWEHHLHVGRRCYLGDEQVLDRGKLLRYMESDKEKLAGLWAGKNTHSLGVDAYHAFNRQFLDRTTPVGKHATKPAWFKWLKH